MTESNAMYTALKTKQTGSILAIFGWSGSGKDTAAALLGLEVVKFAAPGKRTLERVFDLPEGFMDDREAREQVAPYCQGRSYLQVLIDFWSHRDLLVGPDLFPQQVKHTLMAKLTQGRSLAITDVRSPEELQVLLDLRDMGHEVIPFWITGGQCLASDAYSLDLMRSLASATGYHQPFYVENKDKGSLADFHLRIISALYPDRLVL